VTIILFILVLLMTFVIPKSYRADLKILLKNERVNAIVSSDEQAEGLYYLDEVGEARINTESELMGSTELLREVVRHSGLEANENSSSAKERTELAVEHLKKDLKISPIRRSNIIAVSYVSRDPKLAASVLRALMTLYLEFHLRLHSAPGAADVFKQMAVNYARERDGAQAKLDAFKKLHSIASLPEEKALTLQRFADLSKQWSDVQVAVKRSQDQQTRIRAFVASTPPVVEKERRSLPNQMETEQLNIALVNLRSKQVEALARYQPTDRVVRDLDEQIRLTQEALVKAQNTKSEEISTERNSLHVTAQNDYMKAETEIAGLSRQAREIQHQLQEQQSRVLDLDSQTATYDALARAVVRLSELSQTYEKKASDVQAGELLDKQRVANVAIVEAPTEPSSAIFPRRGLIIGLGFIWSLAMGLAAALIADLTAKRIRSPYELELALRAPVVGFLSADVITTPSYSNANGAIYRSLQRELPRSLWRWS